MVNSRANGLERLASIAVRVDEVRSEVEAAAEARRWAATNYPDAKDVVLTRGVGKHPTGEQYVSVRLSVYGDKPDANQ